MHACLMLAALACAFVATARAHSHGAKAVLLKARTNTSRPMCHPCDPSLPRVLCIKNYAAVMPYPFSRPLSTDLHHLYDFIHTDIPKDKSFAQVNNSDFLVFDRERGMEILGKNPTYDLMFNDTAQHEGPVYVPEQNKIYIFKLFEQSTGTFLPQQVIDLNHSPPLFNPEWLVDPPIYLAAGGGYRKGLIYAAICGSTDNKTLGGPSRSGIRTIDPKTAKSKTILNNYYGTEFGCIDDLEVHPVTGDIYFTNNDYAYAAGPSFVTTTPELPCGTFRFNPLTGAVNILDDTQKQPNGLALSPDHRTLYISDTGAASPPFPPSPFRAPGGQAYNATGRRTIYAYDVSADGAVISNKRSVYVSQTVIPDAIRVAANGYLVTSEGFGVTVMDERGTVLVRVRAGFSVQSLVFAGKGMDELWLTGTGAIARVKWALKGMRPV